MVLWNNLQLLIHKIYTFHTHHWVDHNCWQRSEPWWRFGSWNVVVGKISSGIHIREKPVNITLCAAVAIQQKLWIKACELSPSATC